MLMTRLGDDLCMIAATPSERREAVNREQERLAAERQKSILALSSPQFEPRHRIRLWEHLYGMYLPAAPDHRLVKVIAAHTALSLDQVRDEQMNRAATSAASSAPSETSK